MAVVLQEKNVFFLTLPRDCVSSLLYTGAVSPQTSSLRSIGDTLCVPVSFMISKSEDPLPST